MEPSISDVAAEAGVSAATVSRALRYLPNVNEQTAERVRRVAAQLGYAASPAAASLATGVTRTIALVCSRLNTWFVSEAVEAIVRSARDEGFTTAVFSMGMGSRVGQGADARLPVRARRLKRRADAVIVCGLPVDAGEIAELERLEVPLVFLGHTSPDHIAVHIDERATAREATEYLLARGHRTIGHVTGPGDDDSETAPPLLRLRGYEDALKGASVGPDYELVAHCAYSREAARVATRDLLRTRPDITALLGFSDLQCAGILAAAADLGRRVPEDLAVIGIDGSELSEVLGLTTMAQDPAAQGESALSLALEALTGSPVPHEILFPATLIERATT
ncbi:MAG: LacI family DNA-binding transcriptional regulator [Bowdeniella nasicola]|nr:LacI family DNA-binding transcriptional regulator [Bowdeniella nasicola]